MEIKLSESLVNTYPLVNRWRDFVKCCLHSGDPAKQWVSRIESSFGDAKFVIGNEAFETLFAQSKLRLYIDNLLKA